MSDTIENAYEKMCEGSWEVLSNLRNDHEAQLNHQRIHHKAEISEIEGEYARTKSTMLTYVENAQAALGKVRSGYDLRTDKLHVVAYQLDVLAEMLGGE